MKYNSLIKHCANTIVNGGVVAYPTEAIWGLGCDPWNSQAVSTLLQLKKRPIEKGLILVAGKREHIAFLLDRLAPDDQNTLEASWPGHNTWLIPHYGSVPAFVSGYRDTVAVRISTHPVINALCHSVNGPIVSTSANPTGLPAARHRLGAARYFRQHNLPFAPGEVGNGRSASTIRDLRTGATIRK